jgi:hypothetical protein
MRRAAVPAGVLLAVLLGCSVPAWADGGTAPPSGPKSVAASGAHNHDAGAKQETPASAVTQGHDAHQRRHFSDSHGSAGRGASLWILDSKTLAGRRKLQVPEHLQPYLVELARGRDSQAALFGELTGRARKWVQRISKAAGVPKVTAHGMRGLHGTLAVDSGIASHAVASALGHESFRTTAESYAKRDAVAGAQQKRALAVLTGGRAAS